MPTIAGFAVSSQAMLGEISGQTADGQPLALEVSVSCERHPLGNITTVFARDLTARKAMEAQLQQSHKMQAIGTMAGGIAHDFNNILGAILGNVDLARQDAGKKSPAQISLVEIEKAARRARDLVRQILTFSRNESPRRLLVWLADVVSETTRLLKVTLPPNVELLIRIDEASPAVLADATQVEQALLNLCTNAIHAIDTARGRVSIELAQARIDVRHADPLGIAPGHYATLTVRDSGSGIEPAMLQRIFEPFFTTKQVGQGTGLGLAVVHGVMRSHMGTVHVQSAPGVGSTFTLYFPALSNIPEAAREEPARVTNAAVTNPNQLSLFAEVKSSPSSGEKPDTLLGAPSASTAGKHVMYVDDDQALSFLVERALGRYGFKITTFTDPQEAAAALRERAADFDLLVTDYNMPGYCGIDLLREARRIRPELTLALASGYITPEIEQSALAEGACALIHKPNDVSELCDTVQRLLQGETLT
jgi:signal transduction histidine kinase/ActR/RegA family two-component response regulator